MGRDRRVPRNPPSPPFRSVKGYRFAGGGGQLKGPRGWRPVKGYRPGGWRPVKGFRGWRPVKGRQGGDTRLKGAAQGGGGQIRGTRGMTAG